MKWLCHVLLTLSLTLLAGPLVAAEPLRVGIRADNRTIEYATDRNEPAGALVDLWTHWAEQQGRAIDFVLIGTGEGLDLLKDGQIDVLANSASAADCRLSAPYFSYDFYLFSLSDSKRYAPRKFPLNIGLRQADRDYLDTASLAGANVKIFHDYMEMIRALRMAEIDYFLANDVSMNVAVNGLALLKLNYPLHPFMTHHVKAAVRSDNSALLVTFNAGMVQIAEALGPNISDRWLPGTAAFRMSWSLIGLALVILVASSLLIIIWFMNAKLKDQVGLATSSLLTEQELLREARNKAVDSEVYIRNLIDAIHTFIIAVNKTGHITHLNSYAKQFVQGEEPCRNRSFRSCFPFLNQYSSDLIEVLEGQKSVRLRKVELCLNSDEQIVANLAFLPFVVNGSTGALVLIEDISEAVEHDELLVQSQKLELIQSLAGGVAHDFNNILAVISGSANLLKRHLSKAEKPERSKVSRYLENIFNAADKGVATTKGLASLSGRVSVDFDDFSMNLAVESVIQICSSTMDASVQVRYAPPVQTFLVHGNRGLLEQALLNVVINAYHAMTVMRQDGREPGGVLTISLELRSGPIEKRQELCFVVKDNGVGIPAEHIDIVCTPFYTTKKNGVGTGLGLAMVQNSLKQHHGRVEISSVLEEGTEVRLFLPCRIAGSQYASAGQSANGAVLPRVADGQRGVVLLADDNNPVRDSLAENLMLYGYQVIQAKDGGELVDLYRQHHARVDVIVTDLEMPVLTGDKAFFTIREAYPDAKVIISSGFLEDERIRSVLAGGVDDFIQKPCVISELVAKIEALRASHVKIASA